MRGYLLKTCRETALVFIGAAAIIAAMIAITLYLMRNSNQEWGFFGVYNLVFSGGQLFVLRDSDASCAIKLDKPDLMLLAVTTSLCVLAWAVFMRWRSSWRRGPQGLFPLRLSRQAAEPIAVVPIGAIAGDGSGAVAANAGVLLAASPRVRRSKPTILWLTLAAGIIFILLSLMQKSPSGAQKWALDAYESKYLATEGHQQRGRAFEAVVVRMSLVSLEGNRFTWPQVQQYLGPPDLYAGPVDRPNTVAYFYNRFGKKDWMVLIPFNSQGKIGDIGFTATAANNLSGWSTYPTTLPATMPTNTKR